MHRFAYSVVIGLADTPLDDPGSGKAWHPMLVADVLPTWEVDRETPQSGPEPTAVFMLRHMLHLLRIGSQLTSQQPEIMLSSGDSEGVARKKSGAAA